MYDPAARTAMLRPHRPLDLHKYYRLTVRGDGPGGLTGATGVPLDGAGAGRTGTDFVTVVHGYGPWLPVPSPAQAGPARGAGRPPTPGTPVRPALVTSSADPEGRHKPPSRSVDHWPEGQPKVNRP